MENRGWVGGVLTASGGRRRGSRARLSIFVRPARGGVTAFERNLTHTTRVRTRFASTSTSRGLGIRTTTRERLSPVCATVARFLAARASRHDAAASRRQCLPISVRHAPRRGRELHLDHQVTRDYCVGRHLRVPQRLAVIQHAAVEDELQGVRAGRRRLGKHRAGFGPRRQRALLHREDRPAQRHVDGTCEVGFGSDVEIASGVVRDENGIVAVSWVPEAPTEKKKPLQTQTRPGDSLLRPGGFLKASGRRLGSTVALRVCASRRARAPMSTPSGMRNRIFADIASGRRALSPYKRAL